MRIYVIDLLAVGLQYSESSHEDWLAVRAAQGQLVSVAGPCLRR